MTVWWTGIFFVIGILLTVKGGDWFVDAATWLAEATGIPKFIIGATIVSFATTIPELLVSSIATAQGREGMALGNAIGSVNCNTGLIFALTALFMAGAVDMKQFRNKGILFLSACVALLGFSDSGSFGLLGSLIMFGILIIFLIDSLLIGCRMENQECRSVIEHSILNILLFAAGAIGMAIGAKLMVDNGAEIARMFKIPETIIGLTLVAVGTSLPELVTTITALVKKQSDISVGNILGANVMNICLVIPVSSFISGVGLPVGRQSLLFDMPMSIWVACVAVIPTIFTGKIQKWQGVVLLVSYLGYLVILI